MIDKEKVKLKDKMPKVTNTTKDLLIIISIFVLVLILSYFYNVFGFIIDLVEKYPYLINYIDEIIMGLLSLSIGFAVFAWRRWLELKRETAERLKIQEELIRVVTTKAEIERIISKQLRSEIELRRQTEKPIAPLKPKIPGYQVKRD